MPKFNYTVINEENQQLSGSISSPDEAAARKELNQLGFSVVVIEEVKEGEEAAAQGAPASAAAPGAAEAPAAEAAPAEEGGVEVEGMEEEEEEEEEEEAAPIKVFEFGAVDKNQKNVVGTIQSQDRFSAYKRLISEYNLQVEYIIDNELPEAQKPAERAKGAFDLAQKIDEEKSLEKVKVTAEEKDLKDFKRKQEVLDAQIEFVLGKVKALLDMYEKDIAPDTKKEIKTLVDKILRIRRSTNLDYIRRSAEELLTFLQEKEIFLHAEAKKKEKIQMQLEAKSMMMQLKKTGPSVNLDIGEKIRQWKKDNITDNPNPSAVLKAIDAIVTPLIGKETINAEIIQLEKELKIIKGQIRQYAQMYFSSSEAEHKGEIKESIKKLWAKQKDIKKQIKELKAKEVEERVEKGEATFFDRIGSEIIQFCGWLLTFYLIYYFISIYATSKDFGIGEIPFIFYIYNSSFLKFFLITLFLVYSALSLKEIFFKDSKIAKLILAPVTVISTLMIYINL